MKFLNIQQLLWLLLPILLLWVQYQLWLGRGGLLENRQLQAEIRQRQQHNAQLQSRNALLNAEVEDLKHGFVTIEGYARRDLGMIKQGEVFYRFSQTAKK